MKRSLLLSLFATLLMFSANNASAYVSMVSLPTGNNSTVSAPKPSPFATMTVKDFLALTPKKYAALTGEKMSLSQKVSLKIAQAKVKKMVKKNKDVQLMTFAQGIDTSDFSIGGFVLGLLLGVIGVLIAYLIGDSAIIKWSWYGFAVWGVIVLLALLL